MVTENFLYFLFGEEGKDSRSIHTMASQGWKGSKGQSTNRDMDYLIWWEPAAKPRPKIARLRRAYVAAAYLTFPISWLSRRAVACEGGLDVCLIYREAV